MGTIEDQKKSNPRLQAKSQEQYIEMMNNLKILKPKMMDIAIPANK